MLFIKAIRIEINTVDGPYISEFIFEKGLNIIRGDNTIGKSTIFQSILYGLGMEEILGGKNEKTMQSALKDLVEYPKDSFHAVTNSKLFLELENGSYSITILRSIKGGPSPKLIRIYHGALLTEKIDNADFIDTWIHDKGGASNLERGFHSTLESFLNWKLPDVHYSNGESKKLYIQTIFPSFIVEQKGGWADFLSTIPFYGIRNVESKSIEFLLNLDLFENDLKKQAIKDRKSDLTNLWRKAFQELQAIAKRGAIEISNIPEFPEVISKVIPFGLYIFRNGIKVPLKEAISEWEAEYIALQQQPILNTGENISKSTLRLKNLNIKLDDLTLQWELLNQRLRTNKNKSSQYEEQILEVREELRQNRDVKKINSLGGDAGLKTSNNICPTCNQELNDTLFMPEVNLRPMSIDENIKYVEAQEKMILTYLNVVQKNILSDEKYANNLNYELSETREEIRHLKQELVSDERMPSIAEIEKRIALKNKINLYDQLNNDIQDLVITFHSLSDDWNKILIDEEKLPKNYLSKSDYDKISSLEISFKSLLNTLEYTSKDNKAISVSKETEKKFLLPVVEKDGIKYNIRFDSSGSDLIKAIWSYYIALFKISFNFNTNHPKLMIFDEPAQQGVGSSGFNKMLKELAYLKNGQSFIFSSFNESDVYYKEAIENVLGFNLIHIQDKSIRPKRG